LARKPNVTSISLKKQQRDSDKWQIFKFIKVSLFAGMTFSNENYFPLSVKLLYHKYFVENFSNSCSEKSISFEVVKRVKTKRFM
jgi:hypothetical protein